MKKYIGIFVTLGLTFLAFAGGYAVLQYRTDKNEEKVEKHEVQIYDIKELDVRQSVIMERNTELIDKLEKRF